MRFTHLDILEQCFHEKFRGYNSQEVDTFLQLVANDFKEMEEEIENLKVEIQNKNQQIENLEKAKPQTPKDPKALNGISAEAIAEKARGIILFAKEKAEQQKKKSAKELHEIREEIKTLKKEKENLIQNLKAGAKDYLQSLKEKTNAASSGNASKNKKS
ncbi:MAG: DivIVA domain-containing protein [Nitrospinota bacterium]|nr:DivIVA domain-containing protein [Nitrospinota bacterium]